MDPDGSAWWIIALGVLVVVAVVAVVVIAVVTVQPELLAAEVPLANVGGNTK